MKKTLYYYRSDKRELDYLTNYYVYSPDDIYICCVTGSYEEVIKLLKHLNKD